MRGWGQVAAVLAVGCGTPEPDLEPRFVRGGVLFPGPEFVEHAWAPGGTFERGGRSWSAPDKADCVPLFSVPLGDVSSIVFRGGEPPDTTMALSPDGRKLAIGAYTGEVVIVDAWTGAERTRRSFPEALIKRVLWSGDGATLYVGEQSAEARLLALDAETLADRWVVSLAEVVGRSPPPAGDDLYGVYSLPGIFGLDGLENGDLLVTAAHGWTSGDGRKNASTIVRYSSEGVRLAGWPEQGAIDGTLLHPSMSGDRIAVQVGRSADGPPPADLPVGGVVVLDSQLKMDRTRKLDPLLPWFPTVFVWEAFDFDGERLLVGTGDGRVMLFHGEESVTVPLGTPLSPDGVPLAASVGFGRLAGEGALVVTASTSVPYGAADPSWRPPAPHPNANALWFYGFDGELRWTWRGPHEIQGVTLSPDGKEAVVGSGPRISDRRSDLFGALVFRVAGDGSGDERLECFCSTASPVFFRQAWAKDGRFAVSEHPYRDGEQVRGSYQVTVFR